jgi:SAM-dependent methyltransferase
MAYTATDLEAYVRQRAPEIATDIRKVTQKARNEADLVAEVEKLLEKFAKNFDVTLHLERERTLINGRADAVYNRFVIEYEPPNSLQRYNGHRANKHAIEQVQHYMEGLERLDRHHKDRLAGVVLDGGYYIFVRYRDDRWRIDDPLPVDTHSTETFLRYLLSLSTELALTPDNLQRDFGENSDTARRVVPALYQALKANTRPKVDILFRQWQRQFREVSGYDKTGAQLDPAELARLYAVRDRAPDLERLFFVIHTYYATFIKLLALQVAHYYLMPKVGTGLAAIADYESEKLCNYLREMERGGLFAQLGIRNFLEGDFFGWYLDIWDDALDGALRRLMGDLANYSLVTLDVDPEETRDLLKKLYQNLMPKKLRHALGEYYTPDWLAERLLNQLGYKGNPNERLLDPACGSGTFLVLAIKRVRRYADDKLLKPAQVLEQILGNIVGFDLNPLAVITARTNYLLALGDLLESRKGEISIPVYLADSILTPSMEVAENGQLALIETRSMKARLPGYSFNTAVGRFTIPRALVDARYIDGLADLLEESIRAKLTPQQFQKRLMGTFPLDADKDETDIGIVVDLYKQLLELDRQEINGIWARIIKNAFAPLFCRQFEYVAGNPPWVNWLNLPENYRQETAPLWEYYGLFPHRGLEARLGGAMDDISVLMTYVALDRYLKPSGRLGFVITQSVFKTSGGGRGFRRFQLGDGEFVRVVHVDDMKDIQPFEGASNQTAILIINKSKKTVYPVPYTFWRKSLTGKRLATDGELDEILQATVRHRWVAVPVSDSDPTSSWLTGRAKAVSAVKKVIGESPYVARHGVHCWRSAIYWLELVSKRPDGLLVVANLTEGAKEKVDSVEAAIERDLVYPLLHGNDVDRWSATPSTYMLVPQDEEDPSKGLPETIMQIRYPKTYAYLKRFETELLNRSGYKKYLAPAGNPFYAVYNTGPYTFAPYKVVWPNIASDLRAAVVSDHEGRPVMPEHVVTLVPFDSEREAHFVCALVNSAPVNFAVQSYSTRGGKSFGTPHVLKNVHVPTFDPKDAAHRRLAKLSQQAHQATADGDTERVQEIEAEIDEMAAQVWGLTDAELKEIQESLAELG